LLPDVVGYLDDLEEQMRGNKILLDLWRAFRWPMGQWAREQLGRVRENEFLELGEIVKERRDFAAASMFFTDHIEEAGNKLRSRELHHQSKSMSHAEKLHQLCASDILTNFGRKQVEVDNFARQQAHRTLPKSTFFASPKHKNSLGVAFDSLSDASENWWACDYQGRAQGFFAFYSYMESKGNAATLLASWRSLLGVSQQFVEVDGGQCERISDC